MTTFKKNQIRVHMADLGHPVAGDSKYGKGFPKFAHLALHARSIAFTHPFSKKRFIFEAPVPDYFRKLVDYTY